MPTEDPKVSPALAGIQASTLAIYDQRRRLNEAFEALQRAVTLIDPNAELYGDGTIHYKDRVGDGSMVPPVVSEPYVPERQQQTATAVADGAEATPPPPPARPKPTPPPVQEGPQPKSIRRMEAILGALADGKRKTVANLAGELGEEDSPIRYLVNKMVDDGKLIRSDEMPPRFFLPSPVTTRRVENELPEGGAHQHSAPADANAAEDPTSTPSKSDASSGLKSVDEDAESSRTTPDASRRATAAATSGYGLARSPRPMSELKEPSRVAEERRETIMQWFMDQTRPRNGQDFVQEFGTNETKSSELLRDLRVLAERGALVRTGYGYPDYKEGINKEQRGRTSPIYKPAKAGELLPKS